MSLIAILLALGAEYFLGSVDEYRRFHWFQDFIERVRARFAQHAWADGPVGVIIAFAPVLAVVAMAWWVAGGLLWILGFLFTVAVLVYALGPKNLEQDTSGYLDAADRGDHEGAAWYASEMLGAEAAGTPQQVAQRMYEAVFIQANERVLGVLFWFIILGPIGAVLFRLGCEARRWFPEQEGGFAKSLHDLHRILIWPSARIVGLGYALAGSFVGAVSRWGNMSEFWQRDSEGLLVASGAGALNHHETAPDSEAPDVARVRDALALTKRTLVVAIVVLALMTLAGWAG